MGTGSGEPEQLERDTDIQGWRECICQAKPSGRDALQVGAGGMEGLGTEQMEKPGARRQILSGLTSISPQAPISIGKAQSQHQHHPKNPHCHPILPHLQGSSEGPGDVAVGPAQHLSAHVPVLSPGQNMDAVFIFDLCQAEKRNTFSSIINQ